MRAGVKKLLSGIGIFGLILALGGFFLIVPDELEHFVGQSLRAVGYSFTKK